jgi:CBS domain-containing protein
MSAEPETAPADISVAEFIDSYLWRSRHSAFPLTEDGRPAGLVTLNRIKQVPPEQRPATRLRDIACPPQDLAVAGPQEPIIDVLARLTRCADGRALVVSDHRLVGIVSPSDVSRAVQRVSLAQRTPPPRT